MDIRRLLKNRIFIIAIFATCVFFFGYGNADAANLYIKPSQTIVSAGNIINVQILVDTSGKSINNAEGTLQFPNYLLEVISLDSKSSIFSLWVEEPGFSNNIGQVTFNGGVPNPGYQGSDGKIISITFRAKKSGTASLVFSSSAVRENDGLGTDILVNKVGSEVTISDSVKNTITPSIPINTSSTQNPALVVISSSHPKQDSWYSKSDVDLSWNLPVNAVAVKTLLGSHPDSDTSVYYSKPILEKNIKNLDDGILYFHVNYLANGIWSEITHYKIQIDTVNPTNLVVASVKDDSGKINLQMKAEDQLSGVDRYKILVDNEEPINVKADTSGEASLVLPVISAGDHKVVITVYDKAGNFIDTETNIMTDFVPKLSIDSYTAKIKVNESIKVKGKSPYPFSSLSVSIKNNNDVIENYKIKSDSHSNFTFVSGLMEREGNYVLWVDLLKDNGDFSLSSEKVNIVVEKPILLQIGSYTTELLSILVPALIMVFILLFALYYGWHKFFSLKNKIKKDFKQMEERVHNSFNVLYIEASKQLDVLEKAKHRKLSNSEENAKEELKEAIKQMDVYIEKHLHKMEDNDL